MVMNVCRNGDHVVGSIAGETKRLSEWADAIREMDAKIEDFNTRGQRMQVAHPGWVLRSFYCADCGAKLDRDSIPMTTLPEPPLTIEV